MKTTNKKPKHLLTGEALNSHKTEALLEHGILLKQTRHLGKSYLGLT